MFGEKLQLAIIARPPRLIGRGTPVRECRVASAARAGDRSPPRRSARGRGRPGVAKHAGPRVVDEHRRLPGDHVHRRDRRMRRTGGEPGRASTSGPARSPCSAARTSRTRSEPKPRRWGGRLSIPGVLRELSAVDPSSHHVDRSSVGQLCVAPGDGGRRSRHTGRPARSRTGQRGIHRRPAGRRARARPHAASAR